MEKSSGHSLATKCLFGLTALSLVLIIGFLIGKSSESDISPRFLMSNAGDIVFILDQQTGLVRVFQGKTEVRRFDAPVPLDEYTGAWLDGFGSIEDDEDDIDDYDEDDEYEEDDETRDESE